MRILRNIVVGSVFGGSALAIAFACIDRLDHPAPKPSRSAAPVAALTRVRPPDPTVTGSLPAETGPSIRDILGRDGGDTSTRSSLPRTTVSKPTVSKPTPATSTPGTSTPGTAREAAAKVTPRAANPAPKPPVKRTAEGFDTERLNALMRGDPAVTLTRSR